MKFAKVVRRVACPLNLWKNGSPEPRKLQQLRLPSPADGQPASRPPPRKHLHDSLNVICRLLRIPSIFFPRFCTEMYLSSRTRRSDSCPLSFPVDLIAFAAHHPTPLINDEWQWPVFIRYDCLSLRHELFFVCFVRSCGSSLWPRTYTFVPIR